MTVRADDPDVIENHNLHGFDLPFLDRRARRLGVPLTLGRVGPPGLRQRAARRGVAIDREDGPRRIRFVAPGRELIDTMDAVLRHDFATRALPGHGLKAVARHLGIAAADGAVLVFASLLALIIIVRHRTNITRLLRGEELGFRKEAAAGGEGGAPAAGGDSPVGGGSMVKNSEHRG